MLCICSEGKQDGKLVINVQKPENVTYLAVIS